MKPLLFISHTPSANTLLLHNEAVMAMKSHTEQLEIITKNPSEVEHIDGLTCCGILLGTLENIGYMSGITKDLFDRCYNGWLGKQEGLPVSIYIRAGRDGTATSRALTSIAGGLSWRLIQPPVILRGDFDDGFITQTRELAAGFAAGLESGVF